MNSNNGGGEQAAHSEDPFALNASLSRGQDDPAFHYSPFSPLRSPGGTAVGTEAVMGKPFSPTVKAELWLCLSHSPSL